MKINGFLKSDYLTGKEVRELQDQSAIIIGEPKVEVVGEEENERLVMSVELSNKTRWMYGMNKTSARNCADAWGDETNTWVQKRLKFNIVRQKVMGTMRDIIYAEPYLEYQRPQPKGE